MQKGKKYSFYCEYITCLYMDGENDGQPSFFQEYQYKLKNIYAHFYTEKGKEIAQTRQEAAFSFYNNMLREVREPYETGGKILKEHFS